MTKIYIVCESKGLHDESEFTLLKSFKNKASADHYKQDKECEMNKHCFYSIIDLELI